MKIIVEEGTVLYAVDDNTEFGIPILINSVVAEVLPKQFRLEEGNFLFKQSRVSKHDPRVSPTPKKAISAYIIRKKRQIGDLNQNKRRKNDQVKLAKELLKEI